MTNINHTLVNFKKSKNSNRVQKPLPRPTSISFPLATSLGPILPLSLTSFVKIPTFITITPRKAKPMSDYRSKSYSFANGNMQIEPYNYGSNSNTRPNNDFRSYSVSYASSYDYPTAAPPPPLTEAQPQKKGKSGGGSTSKRWNFNDPEFQRKRRVASYKVYSVEDKVKGPFRKSFRWLKDKYTQMLYAW